MHSVDNFWSLVITDFIYPIDEKRGFTFADVINDKFLVEIVAGVWSDNNGEYFVISVAGHFWN